VLSRRSLVLVGVALVALPAPAGAAVTKSPRVASLRALPASVEVGARVRVRGRVARLPRNRKKAVRLTFTLRKDGRAIALRSVKLKRPKRGRARSFSVRVRIPTFVRAGTYRLRACVRKSCRSKRLRVTEKRNPVPPTPGPTPPGPTPPAPLAAEHSLRAPLTGENFYFVMADRFFNGKTSNDTGGIAGGIDDHGFDPQHKGWFHGGDLAGLLEKIDYIQNLGTTAIWLTPSFKNRAVQQNGNNPSAGYHGYWITDFTQIDPHFGTNEELEQLIDEAHSRGIKVFFDIITNHTADVINDEDQLSYVFKDDEPYRTAAGMPFDDRDYAGTDTFPALDPATSFPYTPVDQGDVPKTPAWLNDVTMYHNRGNTTFVGEDSQYGDFFGLDDLFTERPEVVDGMIDIYDFWVEDMEIDGFRIDTMKHVNDEFWQRFSPTVLEHAQDQGRDDFFMFGEVFDTSRPFTSHYTTNNGVQAVLDFPFQDAARSFASKSQATDGLRDFFRDDDYYTDADSNVYQLPTFLGNHDMGHVGMFLRNDNAGAQEPELLARDKLAHALMYLSRGNPVVYFGDEQGFTGTGGDQGARQDMWASVDPEYNNLNDPDDVVPPEQDDEGKNDNIGSDETPAMDNFDEGHPLYREIKRLANLTQARGALRDGAQQHRYSSGEAGIYAFSRIDRSERREFVVALNNAEAAKSATIPTWMASTRFNRRYGDGPASLQSGADRGLAVTVPALSAVVYEAAKKVPLSDEAPSIAVTTPAEGRDRLEVTADVGGDSFYEVTFYAREAGGEWTPIGTDDNAPYRVFHSVWNTEPGTRLEYKAVVLDNAGHTRESAARSARVAEPAITIETPFEGQGARDSVALRATTTPEHGDYVMRFERSVNDGAFTTVGTDDSSPVYKAVDDTSDLEDGDTVKYRAVLTYSPGRSTTSATRTARIAKAPVTDVVIHYKRTSDSNYAAWGLHLFGDGLASGENTPDWPQPKAFEGIDDFGAFHEIGIADDTERVGFIVHGRPAGGGNADVKDVDPDRFLIPLATPEIWLRQGDTRIYNCEAADSNCVVPSA
jgi:alpha-amylase